MITLPRTPSFYPLILALFGFLHLNPAFLTSLNAQSLGSWTAVAPRLTSGPLEKLIWADGRFVALGQGGVLHSVDGKTWVPFAPSEASYYSVCYTGESLFATTNEGITFFTENGFVSTNRHPYALTLWDGEQVLFLQFNALTSSPDGRNDLTTRTAPDGDYRDICWNNSEYLAVGSAGRIARSTTLATWSVQTVSPSTRWLGVSSNGNVHVAVGEGGQIARSIQNGAWSLIASGVATTLRDVLWDGQRFIAVGDAGVILQSNDGNQWTSMSSTTTANLLAIAYSGTCYVICGTDGTLLFNGGLTSGVHLDSSQQRLAGSAFSYPLRVTTTATQPWRVEGLPQWISVNTLSGTGSADLSVQVQPNLTGSLRRAVFFVGSEPHAIVQSPGVGGAFITESGAGTSLFRVASNGSGARVVAGMQVGEVRVSHQGGTWESRTLPLSGYVFSLSYLNGRFLAGVGGGIASSPDAITWTSHVLTTPSDLFEFAWGNGRYVGVGSTVVTSPDGTTWTTAPVSISPNAVAFGANRFVSVGEGGLVATSTDGMSWQTQSSGITQTLHSIAWNGSRFLAVGNRRTIISSTDGITWQLVRSDAPTGDPSDQRDLYWDVVWDGSRWLVAGDPLLASVDGITWSTVQEGISARALAVDNQQVLAITLDNGTLAVQNRSAASVAFSPTSQMLHQEGGTYSLKITTTGAWSLLGVPSWITAAPSSGSGPTTVQLSVAPLPSNSGRVATLRIGSASHTIGQSYQTESTATTIGVFPGGSTPTAATILAGGGRNALVAGVQGRGPVTYQWRLNGVAIPGATGRTLFLHDRKTSDSGRYDFVATRNGSTFTPAGITITVRPPDFTDVPPTATLQVGDEYYPFSLDLINLRLAANGYRWYRNGQPISPPQSLPVIVLDTPGVWSYQLEITTYAGETYRLPATSITVSPAAVPTGPQLANLSSLYTAGRGDNSLIVGFILEGRGTRRLALRGIGPGLKPYGVAQPLNRPSLKLFSSTNLLLNSAIGWQGNDGHDLGGFSLVENEGDTVLNVILGAGARTVMLEETEGPAAEGLAEIYLENPDGKDLQLLNLSTRAVLHENGQLTVGFVLVGDGTTEVVVRGVGPSLKEFQVADYIEDPELTLYRLAPSGAVAVTHNDDWDPQTTGQQDRYGAFSLKANSKDSVMAVSLGAGSYTAIVKNKDGASGSVLVEVYTKNHQPPRN